MGIKYPLQDMFNFKSIISTTASVIAATLAVTFSSPALAGNGCDSVKSFAQSLEQVSSQKPVVECYEQPPVQTPSREGAEVFIYLAALLAGSWGLVAILNMNKTQVQDWDYGFSSELTQTSTTPSPIIWWEEEIFNPSDINWIEESPIQWEDDLDISTIEWEDLDILDIRWENEELSSIIWWEELI